MLTWEEISKWEGDRAGEKMVWNEAEVQRLRRRVGSNNQPRAEKVGKRSAVLTGMLKGEKGPCFSCSDWLDPLVGSFLKFFPKATCREGTA